MTIIGFTLFLIWSLVAVLLYLTNRDLCSPAKLIHAYALVFFLGIFVAEEALAVSLSYFCILGLIAIMGLYEGTRIVRLNPSIPARECRLKMPAAEIRYVILVLWLVSAIPVMAQLYMFSYFGGLAGYITAIALRVKEFSGLGPLTSVIKLLPIINLLYFAVLLIWKGTARGSWALFSIHLATVLVVGLLSGSRGGLLMSVLLMLFVYNYLRRPLTIRIATLGATAILVVGLVLGDIRESISYSSLATGDFTLSKSTSAKTNLSELIANSQTTSSGLMGLRLVFDQGVPDPKYGLTFGTALTNLVPRAIWPDKPRTGGFVLTQEYVGGQAWDGYSNLSTGLFTEGMLNFGVIPGFFISTILFFFLFSLTSFFYEPIRVGRRQLWGLNDLVGLLVYLFVLRTLASLLIGEFTNIIVSLVIQVLGLFAIALVVRFFVPRSACAVPP